MFQSAVALQKCIKFNGLELSSAFSLSLNPPVPRTPCSRQAAQPEASASSLALALPHPINYLNLLSLPLRPHSSLHLSRLPLMLGHLFLFSPWLGLCLPAFSPAFYQDTTGQSDHVFPGDLAMPVAQSAHRRLLCCYHTALFITACSAPSKHAHCPLAGQRFSLLPGFLLHS